MATINVSMQNGLLVVSPNPATLAPGETVTWIFDPSVGPGELNVGFDFARDLSVEDSPLIPVGPMGPFDSIARNRQDNNIIGRVSPSEGGALWRFFCVIFRNGQRLKWQDALGNVMAGGGFDVPRNPPPTTP